MLSLLACVGTAAEVSEIDRDSAAVVDSGLADSGEREDPGRWVRIGDVEYAQLWRAALDVRTGETIDFCGRHVGTLELDGTEGGLSSVTIRGCDPEFAVISGGGSVPGIIALNTDLTLESLAVVDGFERYLSEDVCCSGECDDLCTRDWTSAGGLSVVRGSFEVTNCRFENNVSSLAGAIELHARWIEDGLVDETLRAGVIADTVLVGNGEQADEWDIVTHSVIFGAAGEYRVENVDWGEGDQRSEHYELNVSFNVSGGGNGQSYDLSGITNLHCQTDPAGCEPM